MLTSLFVMEKKWSRCRRPKNRPGPGNNIGQGWATWFPWAKSSLHKSKLFTTWPFTENIVASWAREIRQKMLQKGPWPTANFPASLQNRWGPVSEIAHWAPPKLLTSLSPLRFYILDLSLKSLEPDPPSWTVICPLFARSGPFLSLFKKDTILIKIKCRSCLTGGNKTILCQ